MRPLWIVKTGSTLPEIAARRGDFEDWIVAGLGLPADACPVADVAAGESLPEPDAAAGVVVTGSSAMVSHREPWSEGAARWLAGAVEAGTPVLGICYGHQLLAHALGAQVGPNPRGREIGSVEVVREPAESDESDPLLSVLPERAWLHATHVEAVLEPPPGARLLASTALDPHHAFVVGERAWGVQCHPEFDADVMRGYLAGRRAVLLEEGLDPDALGAAVRETPHGEALLRRFAALVAERESDVRLRPTAPTPPRSRRSREPAR